MNDFNNEKSRVARKIESQDSERLLLPIVNNPIIVNSMEDYEQYDKINGTRGDT